MSAGTALWLLTWAALVVLYLGLAAVLREVTLLRRQLAQATARYAEDVHGPSGAGDRAGDAWRGDARPADGGAGEPAPRRRTDLQITPAASGLGGPVLAADSTCPLCRVAVERLGAWAHATGGPATLLSHEEATAWGQLPPGVRLVRDTAAWSSIAHIEPPMILDVADDGAVLHVVLPSSVSEIDETLAGWCTRPGAPQRAAVEASAAQRPSATPATPTSAPGKAVR